MSGDIEDLGVFHKDYYWAGFSIASTATFSIVNVKEDNRLLGRFILMFEAAFRSP